MQMYHLNRSIQPIEGTAWIMRLIKFKLTRKLRESTFWVLGFGRHHLRYIYSQVQLQEDTGNNGFHKFQAELISLCSDGQLEKAFHLLADMDRMGIRPSYNSYLSLLKACEAKKALSQAKLVHAYLTRRPAFLKGWLSEYLVITLVKCGGLDVARSLFHSLPSRTVYSWTAMISGYTDAGRPHEALKLYQFMEQDGVEPNQYTFVSLLKACGILSDLEEGRRIHANMQAKAVRLDVFIASILVTMYAKCGSILEAENVFIEVPRRDVVLWNAMLTAYLDQCQGFKALLLYRQMQEEGVSGDKSTLVAAVRAYGIFLQSEQLVVVNNHLPQGLEVVQAVHADARKKGIVTNAFLGSTLINHYGKFGEIVEAENVFKNLVYCSVVPWNSMISSFVECDDAVTALQLFNEMQVEGIAPDDMTFVAALQACGILAENEETYVEGESTEKVSLAIGQALHLDIRKEGFESSPFVCNTLVNMYGKCGAISEAVEVLYGLPVLSVVSWNAMLATFLAQKHEEKTLRMYRQMCDEGIIPDYRTFVIVIQSCCIFAEKEDVTIVEGRKVTSTSLAIGQAIHADARRKNFSSNAFVVTSLVSMYGKCGSILEAENALKELTHYDIVLWNVLLMAYANNGQEERALQLYRQMQEDGISADARATMVALQACGSFAKVSEADKKKHSANVMLDIGQALHLDAYSKKFDSDIYLGNTLASMYIKCGSLAKAESVFIGLSERHVMTWNVILSGYLEYGCPDKAIFLYRQMEMENAIPNEQTYTAIFQACQNLSEKEEAMWLGQELVNNSILEIIRALHADANRKGFTSDILVGNSLRSVYTKYGKLQEAENAFEGVYQHSTLSWNALMQSYVDFGYGEKALYLYRQMCEEGVRPNEQTFVSAFQACGHLVEKEDAIFYEDLSIKVISLKIGEVLHMDARDKGFDSSAFVGSMLIDMYRKCGSLSKAKEVFELISQHDAVSWNVMLSAYIEQGQDDSALLLYKQMQEKHVELDEITIVRLLQACSNLGCLEICWQLHSLIVSTGIDLNHLQSTILIHAYGSCASMSDVHAIVDALPQLDVVRTSREFGQPAAI